MTYTNTRDSLPVELHVAVTQNGGFVNGDEEWRSETQNDYTVTVPISTDGTSAVTSANLVAKTNSVLKTEMDDDNRFIGVYYGTTDENGNVLYHSASKFFSLHDKTDITDSSGNHIAHIERKFFSLHERHFITMADGRYFELSNELWHLVKDVSNIEGLGWVLQGNIAGLNFELYDQTGQIIAVISQKMFSLHDKYCIDIYRPEEEQTVVTILITLQHIVRDRANASSFSSSSSSSSN